MRTTSSRDNWERLVAAVIKRDQIWQLCHQDSITTVYSDFAQRDISLRSEPSSPSQLPLTKDSVVEVRKYGSGTITQKLLSALLWRKKSKDYDLGKALVGIPDDHFGLENFSLRELQVATDKFSDKNILGRGAFSEVYKGRLAADGSLVAVKRLREEANVMIGEELEISSIVAHRNVIGLRGFCIAGKERLLVYPYMANGSVASCLKERQESQPPLDWASRPRIALGVARGLAHLHHECIRVIMHRNVNAANILLDEDFEVVVADFTLAKFLDCNDDYGFTEHLFTLETDVYDYGIFLLQLITAQLPFPRLPIGDNWVLRNWLITAQSPFPRLHNGNNLALGNWIIMKQSPFPRLYNGDKLALRNWVMELYGERNFEAMVDRDLKGNFMEEEVEELLQIALLCTQSNPEVRPTMPEVVRMLEDGDGLARNWEVMMMLEVVDGLGEKSEDDCYNVSPDRLSSP